MDLLLLLLQFNGFSKGSDLSKALTIFYGIWFSNYAAFYIRDDYNSDKKNEETGVNGYPWFYMFIHLWVIIQIYYGFRKGMVQELRTGLFMGIFALLLNCFTLHVSHSSYVSEKERIIRKKKEEEEERRRYLEQRNK